MGLMITVSQALTRLARMRENTRNIGRPDAARVIVDTLLHEEIGRAHV